MLYDFLPTCAELTGTTISEDATDDESMTPLLFSGTAGGHLSDPALSPHKAFYWELHEGNPIQGTIWRLERGRNGPKTPIELYDLNTDWQEKRNVR